MSSVLFDALRSRIAYRRWYEKESGVSICIEAAARMVLVCPLDDTDINSSLHRLPKPRSIAEERPSGVVPHPHPARRAKLAAVVRQRHGGQQAADGEQKTPCGGLNINRTTPGPVAVGPGVFELGSGKPIKITRELLPELGPGVPAGLFLVLARQGALPAVDLDGLAVGDFVSGGRDGGQVGAVEDAPISAREVTRQGLVFLADVAGDVGHDATIGTHRGDLGAGRDVLGVATGHDAGPGEFQPGAERAAFFGTADQQKMKMRGAAGLELELPDAGHGGVSAAQLLAEAVQMALVNAVVIGSGEHAGIGQRGKQSPLESLAVQGAQEGAAVHAAFGAPGGDLAAFGLALGIGGRGALPGLDLYQTSAVVDGDAAEAFSNGRSARSLCSIMALRQARCQRRGLVLTAPQRHTSHRRLAGRASGGLVQHIEARLGARAG